MSGPLVSMFVFFAVVALLFFVGRATYPPDDCRTRSIMRVGFMMLSAGIMVVFTVLSSEVFDVPFKRPDQWFIFAILGLSVGVIYYDKITERRRPKYDGES